MGRKKKVTPKTDGLLINEFVEEEKPIIKYMNTTKNKMAFGRVELAPGESKELDTTDKRVEHAIKCGILEKV
jgi:hypothetical protein